MRTSPTRPAFLSAVVAAGCLCATSTAWSGPPPLGLATRVEVASVVDGDTVEVKITKYVRVRLVDCWASELNRGSDAETRRGQLAKSFLERQAAGRQGVLFVPTEKSNRLGDVWSFDRVLGHIWLDDQEQSLSQMMVESGYATKERP